MLTRARRSWRSCLLGLVAAGVAWAGAEGAAVTYSTVLSGPAESPPVASPGTGWAIVDIDVVAHTMRVRAQFSGLLGVTTAAHIHSMTAVTGTGTIGVATTTPTFAGFPGGVTSGTYDQTLDLTLASSFNPSFITANGGTLAGAEAALAAGLAAGKAYFNLHSNVFPGGEIRGFLFPAPLGPCCDAAGTCVLQLQALCSAGGNWAAGGACTPASCMGACCVGAACTLSASAAACAGTFRGSRTACTAMGRSGPVSLCCAADFNNSGTVTVQDIFGFLTAWFAGCP